MPKLFVTIRLREAMAAHGQRTGEHLTYSELAKRTGLSRSTIESIAARNGYNASLKTIGLLCGALRCRLEDILALELREPGDSTGPDPGIKVS